MRAGRNVLIVALVILVAAVGAGVWLYHSLDSIVAGALNTYGPEIVGAKFRVASVKIAPASGAGEIHGLFIGNPEGFKTESALTAATVSIEIDPSTLTDDVVLIRSIAIAAPAVTYETGPGGSNFDALQRNVMRGVKEKLGDKGRGDAKTEGPGKKIIIEHLTIRDAKASVNSPLLAGKTLTVPLPDIELRNIGKDQHGIAPAAAGGVIVSALTQRVTAAATGAISNFAKSGVEAVGKGVSNVQGGVKKLFGK